MVGSFILWLASLVSLTTYAGPFHVDFEEIAGVRAKDGTVLSLLHLDPQGLDTRTAPCVLLEPGLVETAYVLDGVAEAFHNAGFDVFAGQVRQAGRGRVVSGRGRDNGLEKVLLDDFPAHYKKTIELCPGRDVGAVGHSMGGIAILTSASDPVVWGEIEETARKYGSTIGALTILSSPHHLHDLPNEVRTIAKVLMRILEPLLKPGASIHPLEYIFDKTASWKTRLGGVFHLPAKITEQIAVEMAITLVNTLLLSRDLMSTKAQRTFWFRELSGWPADLLLDFARAAVAGEFVGRDGRKLIRVSKIPKHLKIQVASAEKDFLASPRLNWKLYRRLKTAVKSFLLYKGLTHVDVVAADLYEDRFLLPLIDFHLRPEFVAQRRPVVTVDPKLGSCERALKPLKFSRTPFPLGLESFRDRFLKGFGG